LEFEIAQGAWLSAEAVPEIIFEVPADEMWEHVVRGMGIEPSSLVSTTGVH
jgi:putative transcriptional regulator